MSTITLRPQKLAMQLRLKKDHAPERIDRALRWLIGRFLRTQSPMAGHRWVPSSPWWRIERDVMIRETRLILAARVLEVPDDVPLTPAQFDRLIEQGKHSYLVPGR